MKAIGSKVLRTSLVGCFGALTAAVPLSLVLAATADSRVVSAAFGLVLGAVLAGFFTLFERMWHQQGGRLVTRVAGAGAVGAAGGLAGAVLGQRLYMALGSRVVGTAAAGVGIPLSLGAAAGWSLTGLSIAVAVTVPFAASRARWLHASLGGAVGGFLGGLGMQAARPLLGAGSMTVGLVVLGGAVGFGMSWMERALARLRLQILKGNGRGSEFPLGRETLMGSDPKCPVHLTGAGVASRHARIRVEKGEAFLEDLGSPLGLVLNGRKMSARLSRLAHGDLIQVGGNVLRVQAPVRLPAGSVTAAAGIVFAALWLIASAAPAQADPGLTRKDPRISQVDTSRYPLVDLYTSLPASLGPGRVRSFMVSEGGRPAAVLEVRDLSRGTRDAPLSISLVVDISGSMKGVKIVHAREALGTFADSIPASARINLVAFNDAVELLAAGIPPAATGDYVRRLEPSGHTALFDALRRGTVLLSGQAGRKAVITLTDGMANRGDVSMEEALMEAEGAGVSLFFVGLGEDARRERLTAMARRTGGRTVFTHEPAELESLFDGFAQELSREVLIRYRATGTGHQVVPIDLTMVTGTGAVSVSNRYMSPRATFMGSAGSASWLLALIGLAGPVGLLAMARLNAFNLSGPGMLLVEGSSAVTRQFTRLLVAEGQTVPMAIGGQTVLIDNQPSDGTRVLRGGETLSWGETTMVFNKT